MSSEFVKRRLFSRVVLWDTKGGTILDLPTRYVLPGANPVESEEYVDLANGSQTPIRRTHEVNIPITARELDVMGEVIQRTKCPVKAAFIGPNGTDNFLWLEPTRLQITDPEIDPGQQARKILKLKSNVFYPGIWEGSDLISGVPWQGTHDWKNPDNNAIEIRQEGKERRGYQGPIFEVSDNQVRDRSVSIGGATTAFSSTNPAIINFEFPVWNTEIVLEAPAGYRIGDATLRTKRWDGLVLESDSSGEGASVSIEKPVFSVELEVLSTEARPRLKVVNTVKQEPKLWVGEYNPDCAESEKVSFDPLPNPNDPPKWINKEKVLFVPGNNVPVWDDRDNLQAQLTEEESLTNNPPVWENRQDLTFKGETSGGGGNKNYDLKIEDSQHIYTSLGGECRIDWNGAAVANLFDQLATGDLAVDHQGYNSLPSVFYPTSNGIERVNPTVKSNPPPTTTILSPSSGTIESLSVDVGTSTIYYTYEAKDGIYKTGYDTGSGETQVTSNLPASNGPWYIEVDSSLREGYIFASSSESIIYRFNIDGTNRTQILEQLDLEAGKSFNRDISVSQYHQKIIIQEESQDEKRVYSIDYDGNNKTGRFGVFASSLPSLYIGIGDKEDTIVTVSKVDGSSTTVSYEESPNQTLSSADTGEFVVVSFAYTDNS
jgi:hypothetical protein